MWQHLSLAGFVAGSYVPAGQGISYGHERGVNTVPSQLDNALWAIARFRDPTIASFGADGQAAVLAGKHVLVLGKSFQPVGTYWSAPKGFLLPEDAWSIDKKIDDGEPYTGIVTTTPRSGGISSPGAGVGWFCTDTPYSSTATTAKYNLTGMQSTSPGCLLFFSTSL